MLEEILFDPQRVRDAHAFYWRLKTEAEAAAEKVRECEKAVQRAEWLLEDARHEAECASKSFDETQEKVQALGLRSTSAWSTANQEALRLRHESFHVARNAEAEAVEPDPSAKEGE